MEILRQSCDLGFLMHSSRPLEVTSLVKALDSFGNNKLR
jgi:hypothetical protein